MCLPGGGIRFDLGKTERLILVIFTNPLFPRAQLIEATSNFSTVHIWQPSLRWMDPLCGTACVLKTADVSRAEKVLVFAIYERSRS